MRSSQPGLNPEERPEDDGGHVADIAITPADRATFMEELASTYNTAPRADLILDAIGFPAAQRPSFTESSVLAWNDIFREIARGIVPAGFRQLLEYALRVYGHNAVFGALRDRYLQQPQAAVELESAAAPVAAAACHVIFRADDEEERGAVGAGSIKPAWRR